jgi:hypothetical protein
MREGMVRFENATDITFTDSALMDAGFSAFWFQGMVLSLSPRTQPSSRHVAALTVNPATALVTSHNTKDFSQCSNHAPCHPSDDVTQH